MEIEKDEHAKLRQQVADLENEAGHAYIAQDWLVAHRLFTKALALSRQIDNVAGVRWVLHHLSVTAERLENWTEALHYGYTCLKMGIGSTPFQWLLVGRAERRCGRYDDARHALAHALRSNQDSGTGFSTQRFYESEIFHEWGLLEAEGGNLQAGVNFFALSELVYMQLLDGSSGVSSQKIISLVTQIAAHRQRLQALLDAQNTGDEL